MFLRPADVDRVDTGSAVGEAAVCYSEADTCGVLEVSWMVEDGMDGWMDVPLFAR